MLLFIFFFVLGLWAIGYWVKKLDENGVARSIAKQSLINVISRWLK